MCFFVVMFYLELYHPLVFVPVTVKLPVCVITGNKLVAKSECIEEEDEDDVTSYSVCHLEGGRLDSSTWHIALLYYTLDTMFHDGHTATLTHIHYFTGTKLHGDVFYLRSINDNDGAVGALLNRQPTRSSTFQKSLRRLTPRRL